MKILYVAPFAPWRARVRSYNVLTWLATRHAVYLVCQSHSAEEEAYVEPLLAHCREVVCVPHRRMQACLQCVSALPTPIPLRLAYSFSPKMRKAVRRAVEKFSPDIVYVDRWRALVNVPSNIGVPVICDPTDSMLLYNLRLWKAGNWLERMLGLEEALKFLRYEPRLSRRPSLTIFCSRVDLECVRKRAPQSQFSVVPNGVDCRLFPFKDAREEEASRILFAGSFTYAPNRHAAEFFVQRVFPLVRCAVPGSRLVIVGNQARRHLKRSWAGLPNLEIMDFVPELQPQLAKATVAVAPITVGVGVTNKLLEAFATGTAAVATPLACGDLPVRDGEHLLIAERPEEFAGDVVRLLRDPDLRRRLARNARELVEREYDLEIVCRKLEKLLAETASGWARYSTASAKEFVAPAIGMKRETAP